MDFSQFDTTKKSSEGVFLDIFAPDEMTKLARFKIAGRDSKILKRRQQELAKKRAGKKKISPVEEEQDTLETIAVCTLGWDAYDDKEEIEKEGVILDEGKELEFSFEAAKKLYEKYPWIAEQVVEFIADRSNFL